MRRFCCYALLAVVGAAYAQEVELPHVFQAGTPARAADVNANFAALADAVNDHGTALATLLGAGEPQERGTLSIEALPYTGTAMPIYGIEWNGTMTVGGGGGAGVASFGGVKVFKPFDLSSPQLLIDFGTGKHRRSYPRRAARTLARLRGLPRRAAHARRRRKQHREHDKRHRDRGAALRDRGTLPRRAEEHDEDRTEDVHRGHERRHDAREPEERARPLGRPRAGEDLLLAVEPGRHDRHGRERGAADHERPEHEREPSPQAAHLRKRSPSHGRRAP